MLVAFVVTEHRREQPLIDVSLFLRPGFAAANLAALVVFFAFVGAIVYFSAYFQEVQGRSPAAAGLAVCAIGVAYALAAAWSGRLVGRFGERWPLLGGLILGGLATLGSGPPRARHQPERDLVELRAARRRRRPVRHRP